jgi:hypothetical protein
MQANELRAQYVQGIGHSIQTAGVDPTAKYSFPQTSSQVRLLVIHSLRLVLAVP